MSSRLARSTKRLRGDRSSLRSGTDDPCFVLMIPEQTMEDSFLAAWIALFAFEFTTQAGIAGSRAVKMTDHRGLKRREIRDMPLRARAWNAQPAAPMEVIALPLRADALYGTIGQ